MTTATTTHLPIDEWIGRDIDGYVVTTFATVGEANIALDRRLVCSAGPVAQSIRPDEVDFYNGRRLGGASFTATFDAIVTRRRNAVAR